MAAIAYGHGKGRDLYNEADWTNLDNPEVMPYPRSKTVAERAARDWIAAEGRFPSTMVDRIVPATKRSDSCEKKRNEPALAST